MKTRFFTLTLLLTAIALNFSSCTFLNKRGSISTDDNIICASYENSERSQLEVDLIHNMTDNFQKMAGPDEAKAVLFDLETLKKFVYHLEIAANQNNISSHDLGIRIYYGRYPKKEMWSPPYFDRDLSGFLNDPITETYPLKQTVIMVPTRKIGSIHQDFDPYNAATYGGLTQQYNRSNSADSKSSILMFALSGSNASSTAGAQNHGRLYPPYSGGTFF